MKTTQYVPFRTNAFEAVQSFADAEGGRASSALAQTSPTSGFRVISATVPRRRPALSALVGNLTGESVGQMVSDDPHHPLTTTERAQRNRRIARARADGEPWARIAARENLSVRQASRCADEHLRATVPAPMAEGLDVARRVIEIHLASLVRLEELGRSANSGVAVAAVSRAPAIAVSLLDVATRGGLVPPQRYWAYLEDMPRIATAFLAAAARLGIPSDVVLAEMGVAADEADAPELADLNLNHTNTKEQR